MVQSTLNFYNPIYIKASYACMTLIFVRAILLSIAYIFACYIWLMFAHFLLEKKTRKNNLVSLLWMGSMQMHFSARKKRKRFSDDAVFLLWRLEWAWLLSFTIFVNKILHKFLLVLCWSYLQFQFKIYFIDLIVRYLELLIEVYWREGSDTCSVNLCHRFLLENPKKSGEPLFFWLRIEKSWVLWEVALQRPLPQF